MKYSKEEIVKAVTLISNICKVHDCADEQCPFRDEENECVILQAFYPEEWCIRSAKEEENWKVFEY